MINYQLTVTQRDEVHQIIGLPNISALYTASVFKVIDFDSGGCCSDWEEDSLYVK